MSPQSSPTQHLLSGVTVLNLGAVGPAARAGRMLADYGARVVMIAPVSKPPSPASREGIVVEKVNLADRLASFDETWVPKVVAELNGQLVKVVKFEGPYVWHHHDDEDEMFLVLSGRITIHLPDSSVVLDPGEFLVVPRGVEHKPVADGVAHVLLFEPASTRNTGQVDHEYTIEPDDLKRI